MENRFGIKDLFLFLLVAGLIVVVVHGDVPVRPAVPGGPDDQAAERMTSTTDIAKIRRQLAEGVQAVALTGPLTGGAGSATQPTTQKVDTFTHLCAAEKKPGFATGDWLIDNFGDQDRQAHAPSPAATSTRCGSRCRSWRASCATDPYTLEQVPRLATRWEISPDGLVQRYYLRRGVDVLRRPPADRRRRRLHLRLDPQPRGQRRPGPLLLHRPQGREEDRRLHGRVHLQQVLLPQLPAGHRDLDHAQALLLEVHARPVQRGDRAADGFRPVQAGESGRLDPDGPRRQLVRNERYWGEPATFDRLVFNEVEGEATEMVMYGNQELDLIRCTPEQYNKLQIRPAGDGRSATTSNTTTCTAGTSTAGGTRSVPGRQGVPRRSSPISACVRR